MVSEIPKTKLKSKHRPSALAFDKNNMQDLAVDILSPGLNETALDPEQKSILDLSKKIEQDQQELIASKNGTKTSKKRSLATPTIIIEQVSNPDINTQASQSPLPSAKKFKRDKAPPPLKFSSGLVAPSIQTAPIRNAGYYAGNLRQGRVARRPAPLANSKHQAVASPMALPYFAPRYYPVIPSGAVQGPLTPSVYANAYYRQLLMKSGSYNSPQATQFAGMVPGYVPGAPLPANVQTPTVAGIPVTPLNYAFQQNPALQDTDNYSLYRKEPSLSDLNKKYINEPRKSLQSPLSSTVIKQTLTAKNLKPNGEPKTPINLQKSNTPHVTDVFPGDLTKFAPLLNQPLSSRDEHFDFNMYKDEKPMAQLRKTKNGTIPEVDEEDDVESKAIEDGSKWNIELETETKTLKTTNIKQYGDYRIDVRFKTDFGHKQVKFKFEEEPAKKSGKKTLELDDFLKQCKEIWNEFATKKKEFEDKVAKK